MHGKNAHIVDQMTDVGVIVSFYLLYIKESNPQYGSMYCETINPLSLFILSVMAFFFYRFASAVAIYAQTKSWQQFVLQLFDLGLYRALLVNYQLKLDRPCNPQRWLQSLEAIFEAFPQTLIQLFFITKTNSLNVLVVVSIVWSLWSIISKTCNEDRLLFEKKYSDANSHCFSKQYWKKKQCISVFYVCRIVYRAGDVIWRVLILLLVWVFMGGFLFSCLFLVELIFLIFVAVCSKKLSLRIFLYLYF